MPAHPFTIANFRAYWIARFSMTVAQTGMILIISWQTYTIARETMSTNGAAGQLALIGLLQFVPLFVSTPITGYVADRFDRRWIVRLTVLLQLLCALVLALVTWADAMSIPVLFGVAIALGFGRAFAGPAFGALAPNLVPRESLPTAIALSSISWQVGSIIGPAVGGIAYAWTPPGAYFLATALYAAAAVALMTITPVPRTQRVGSDHPLRQIGEGLIYVWRNKMVFSTITLDLFAVFLAGATALLPIYAHDVLHVGPQGLSALAAAPAIGATVTGLIFSVRPLKNNVGPTMLGAVFVFGAATLVFGLSKWLPLSLVALTIAGGADMVSVYIRQSLIQLYTPDAMRGRVGAVSQLTISASNELGDAQSGALAWLLGPVAAVLIGGGGAIAVTALWTYLFPVMRRAKTFDPPTEPRDAVDMEIVEAAR